MYDYRDLCGLIQLSGPLCTHSAFGFENKNWHLKQFWKGNAPQLLFNVDVSQTLQLVHHKQVTRPYTFLKHQVDLHHEQIEEHTYIIRHCQVNQLTEHCSGANNILFQIVVVHQAAS